MNPRYCWAWAFVLPMVVACSSSSPTPTIPSPNETAPPQFRASVTLETPGSISLSEPLRCSGDWSTCPRGPQPQGPVASTMSIVREFTLPPGTYYLTGVVRPSTSMGAWANIRLTTNGLDVTRGGVIREAPVFGAVAFDGEPGLPLNALAPELCGGRVFANPTGALEWSITFTLSAEPTRQLCR